MTKVITLRKKRKSTYKKESISKKKFESILNEKYKIFLLLISVVGILFGSLIYRYLPNTDISTIINENLELMKSGQWIKIFLYFIEFDALFLFLTFFIGTSYIGSFLSSLPIAMKCVFIGFQSGYLYNEFELKGVLFCLVLLFPCYIITTASLVFAANESIYMSKYLFQIITNKNTANDISVRLYLLRYLFLFTINIVCYGANSFIVSFLAPKINLV